MCVHYQLFLLLHPHKALVNNGTCNVGGVFKVKPQHNASPHYITGTLINEYVFRTE